MTNTQLLEEAIKNSGRKKMYLAEKCGLTTPGFRNKLLNKHPFTTEEVKALCKELDIKSATRMKEIFLAEEDEKKGN